jgi:ABC-2 type transport system ATP-binding protein
MTTPIIEVSNLKRNFGKLEAVRGISFEILPGQVVGFIGANGAGKTTTMRMMATLELPTGGKIRICGYDVLNFPNQVRRKIGWMPDTYGTYNNTTVAEYLDFYGRAFGFKFPERRERVAEVMEFTDLASISDRPINKLSKGMGQRLCLGRTLLHDPEVLILDEPAAGLDPKARIEFKNLVRLLAENGKTIFISSHILSELGEMCDTLLFIDAGVIVHHGSADSLKQTNGAAVVVDVQVDGKPELLAQWAMVNPGVKMVDTTRQGGCLSFASSEPADLAAALKKMITDGVPVVEFHRRERRLEDAFVEMLKKVQGN